MSDQSKTRSHPRVARHGVRKIVSGGQTGVDRGALDAAIALGIEHGGWCPKGRLAEDGIIAEKYQLVEMNSSDYSVRTQQNVTDSDGTLILYRERLQGGTLLTDRLAKAQGKPNFRVRLDRPIHYDAIVDWIVSHGIATLNIAGPRGSSYAGLERLSCEVVKRIFATTGLLPLGPNAKKRKPEESI